MKRVIITIALAMSTMWALNAQVDTRNIGIRAGGGLEASYQHPLTSHQRLEFDLGLDFHSSGVNATGIYQFVFDLSSLSKGFNWYVGPGVGVGIWDKALMVAGVGQLGIEYNFNIPVQLSLDWRPGIAIGFYDGNTSSSFWSSNVALGIRYKF